MNPMKGNAINVQLTKGFTAAVPYKHNTNSKLPVVKGSTCTRNEFIGFSAVVPRL